MPFWKRRDRSTIAAHLLCLVAACWLVSGQHAGAQGIVTTPIGSSDDEAFAVAIDPSGKIVVAGRSFSTDDDFAVVRYNPDFTPDSSFDGDGIATTDLGADDRANAVAIQPDGKIVVAGFTGGGAANDFAVLRYNVDGSLDTSFDGDGIATRDLGGDDQGRAVAIQSDGKIVVAGYSDGGGNFDFIVMRYDTNGTLDGGFGTSGIATTDFGGARNRAEAVAIQSDGKIVAAGDHLIGAAQEYMVVRYDTSGTPDPGFDGDGIAITPVGGNEDNARFVAIQADGMIVVAGSSNNGADLDFSAVRYDTAGTPDPGFSGDGKVLTDMGGNDIGFGAAIQADGKIVVSGFSDAGADFDFAALRYDSAGVLDPGFGTGGIVTTPVGGGNDFGYRTAIEANGNIVVAGSAGNADLDVGVIRYCPAGVLVTNYTNSFGFRKPITISGSQVGGSADLVDFPVLIHVTDPDLRTTGSGGNVERTDGADIVFREGCAGAPLDHEVEKYVFTTGELVAWVRVPLLRHNMDTVIFVYYGNTNVGCSTENPNGVWTNDYRGVWHLGEQPIAAPPQFIDSTSNGNDGTANSLGLANQVSAKIEEGLLFDDTNERHALMPHDVSLQLPTAMTVSAWIQTSDVNPDDAVIAMKWDDDPLKRNYWLGKITGTSLSFFVDDTQTVGTSWASVNDGIFHHVVGVADPSGAPGGGLRIYVDGVEQNEAAYTGSSRTETGDFRIGNSTFPFQTFDGTVDEVRVASSARSAGWVETAFRNQNAPGSFHTVGAQQAAPFTTPWIYGYRKKLTIDNTRVTCGSDVSDFPVLISLVDPDLRTVADGGRIEHPNGYDIVFRDSTGANTLASEIEAYSSSGANGTLVAWVRVPTMAASADTDIFMYYGNPAVSCPVQTQYPSGVWDANYRGVWHLREDLTGASPQVLDSTSNWNHGSPAGGMTSANQVPGNIAGSLDFDGIDDLVNAGTSASLDDLGPLTASAWVRPDVFTGNAGKIVAKYEAAATPGRWYLELDDSAPEDDSFEFLKDFSTTELQRITVDGFATYTNWQHVAVTWDGSAGAGNVHIYRNGVEAASYQVSTDGVGSKDSDVLHPFILGNRLDGTQGFDGLLDEIRVSDIERPLCWIQTEYNNQNIPTKDALCTDNGFVCVGAEEVGPPTAVKLGSLTATASDGAIRLAWETASELDNLGFHVYRSLSQAGPSERLTETAIPGLGSSPVGARYSYHDTDVGNGTTHYYWVEDIETTGKTKLHGPVSATPESRLDPEDVGGAKDSDNISPARIVFGDPSQNSFRVVKRGRGRAVLELETSGFYAEPLDDGTVRIDVPGLEAVFESGSPSLPVKRSWLEAVAGRRVSIRSVRVQKPIIVGSLRPAGSADVEVVAAPSGTVRAQRRAARALFESSGLYPEEAARLVTIGFQGDTKKALVELAPLRFDASTGQLLLARRLTVYIVFRGREPSERETFSGRGRLYRGKARDDRNVVARLLTKERGLYGVRYEDVWAGRRGVPARALYLSRQGKPVAFHLEPGSPRFRPGSVLYFLGEGGAINPYGHEAAYELSVEGSGLRMAEHSAGSPQGEAIPFYWERREHEENRYYQAALLKAPDVWLWELIFAPAIKSFPFEVDDLAGNGPPSRLVVQLQGASDFDGVEDHHVRIYVNGTPVAESNWDGKRPETLVAELSPGVVREGENVLEIEGVGDTAAPYSMVMLDRFAIEYPRSPLTNTGRLEGSWSEAGVTEVTGLSPDAHVVDLSGDYPTWMVGPEPIPGGGLRFGVEAGHRYLMVNPESALRPRIARPVKSRLRRYSPRADYVVIGPKAFLAEAEPLLTLRRDQGLKVKAVSVEEIYSEFGYGEATPESIREFVAYAYHHWRAPSLRYVLLLGDATFDFKDHLATGVTNQVPPLMIKTSYLWTVSDPTIGAVNGEDILPDIAVGRLPAANLDELRRMIQKIVRYETEPAAPGAVFLIADNADEAGNFESDANDLAEGVLSSLAPRKIFLGELGVSNTRSAVVDAFDGGASLMSYIGHGAIHLWADENVFSISDVDWLDSQSRQPLLLTMNCLNGYFHFPYFDSLAERLLQADGKGVIAAFSPSGLSLNAPAHRYHRALFQALIHGGHARLGDAVLDAQEAYAETGAYPELLSIYHLLGDPALVLPSW